MATAPTAKPPLSLDVRLRLSVMMFLQFAVWGAWFVVFFNYLLKLGFDGGETGWIFGNMALGAILAPMVVGMLADRFMASEKLMAILHLAGAGVLFLQAQLDRGDPTSGFWIYFGVTLLYSLLYNPTLALANSISFTHVPDATRDFPGLRVWGTIGWIVANLVVGFYLDQNSNQPLLMAAVLSAVLGVLCFGLPHTPPTGKPGDQLPFLGALGLFRDYSFAVFFIVSGLLTVVLAFYYSNTPTFLQQSDARMVPGLVQGYFHGTDTVKLSFTDKDKPATTTATLINVKAVTITRTKEVDGKEVQLAPPARRVLTPPIEEDIEVEKAADGTVSGVKLTTTDSTQVEEQAKRPGADGKPDEWAKVGEGKLTGGGTLNVSRDPGETLTVTFERVAINPANTMLWGQIAEMILLPLLPWFLIRYGMKWVLVLGMLCWGLRYLLFAGAFPGGPQYYMSFWAIFVGVLLHGICFDFFFAAAFIHVDNTAPKAIRASAQALFSLLTYGVGMWLGSILSGYLNQAFTVNPLVGQVDWTGFWKVPAFGVIAAVLVFVLLFHTSGGKGKKEA